MFIFLMGSYDIETKKLLDEIQDSLANMFVIEGHYALIMESLDVYLVSDGHLVICEKGGKEITIYTFENIDGVNKPLLLDIDTIDPAADIDYSIISSLITKNIIEPTSTIEKMPLTGNGGLFSSLIQISDLFITLRLKEETRGGEYIELCWILDKVPNLTRIKGDPSLFLFKSYNITLTTMLSMYIEEGSLVVLEFVDFDDLESKLAELIRFRTQNSPE